jgi:hypothetical protein
MRVQKTKSKKLQIEERDWIIIRLLYFLLQDSSNTNIRDVQRTMDYLKQTREDLWNDITLINYEHAVKKTFDAPDVMLARQITKTVEQTLIDLVRKND